MTLSLEKITYLLNGVKHLPPLRKQEQTFMEIAGYPHFENVCSNILQFYLQPSNEHGFGSLLLDSLFTLINEEAIDGQNIDVRREETTPERKRIDLVIESDNFVLGIENKIFAGLSKNQLKNYAEYLESISNGRKVLKVLLSLRPLKVVPEDLYGFNPITYQLMFEQVIANIGSYFLTSREPHTIFFRDFIQTIQNLQKKTSMDEQRLAFFRDNQKDIAILLDEVDTLRENIREKLINLKLIIADDLALLLDPNPIESSLWRSSDFQDFLGYVIKMNSSSYLQIDVALSTSGWRMQFFSKRGGNLNEVEEWLKSRGIKYENYKGKRLKYKGENHILPYNTSPDVSAKWVLDMLKRLTIPLN